MPRPLVIVTMLVLVVPCLGPSVAAATDRRHWAKSTLTYRDLSTYRAQVRTAVSWWNNAGTRLRLRPARRGRRADFVIRTKRVGGQGLFWNPPVSRIDLDAGLGLSDRRWLIRPGDTRFAFATGVAAHEIGHAIGLDHNMRTCSIVGPGANALWNEGMEEAACRARVHLPDTVPCGPQPADVRDVARLYGWKPGGKKRVRDVGRCPAALASWDDYALSMIDEPARTQAERLRDALVSRFNEAGTFAGADLAPSLDHELAARVKVAALETRFAVSVQTLSGTVLTVTGEPSAHRPFLYTCDQQAIKRRATNFIGICARHRGQWRPITKEPEFRYPSSVGAPAAGAALPVGTAGRG